MIRRPHRRSRRARQSVRIKPNCPPLSPSAPQPPPAPTRPPGAPPAGPRRYPAPMPSPPPTRPPALRRRRAAASEAAVQGPDAKATAHGHAAGHTELLTGRDRQAQVRPGHAGDVLRLAAARKGGARVVDRQVGEVVGGAVGLAEARLRRGKVGKERGATPDPLMHAHPAPPSPPPPGRALRRVLARPRAASSRAPPSRDVATAKSARRSTSPRTRPTSSANSKSAASASVRGAPRSGPGEVGAPRGWRRVQASWVRAAPKQPSSARSCLRTTQRAHCSLPGAERGKQHNHEHITNLRPCLVRIVPHKGLGDPSALAVVSKRKRRWHPRSGHQGEEPPKQRIHRSIATFQPFLVPTHPSKGRPGGSRTHKLTRILSPARMPFRHGSPPPASPPAAPG